MKFIAILFAIVLPVTAVAQTPVPVPTPEAVARKIVASRIVLVGDSTTAVMGGWGPSFCAYHVTSFVACINLARGGRSSGNYRVEGSWDIALAEMKSGGFASTYVLIQFGHNDQPGKPGRSTDLTTEFPANLKRYVIEARAAGAIPVLVTPLTRRMFKDGQLSDDLGPWAEATRKVATEMNVPLIDLYTRSRAIVEALGPVEAMRFAQEPPSPHVREAAKSGTTIAAATPMPLPANATEAERRNATESMTPVKTSFDYTHIGREGADVFSEVVVEDLVKVVPELSRGVVLKAK